METSVNYTAYFLPIKLNILKGKILNFSFLFGDFVLRQEPDMLAKKKKKKSKLILLPALQSTGTTGMYY